MLRPDGELETLFAPNFGDEDAPPPDVDVEQAAASAASQRPFTVDATDGDLRYRAVVPAGRDGGYWITAIPLTDVDDTSVG